MREQDPSYKEVCLWFLLYKGFFQIWFGNCSIMGQINIYISCKKTRLECQLHHHMPWCAIYMKNHHWRCIIWENTAIVERRLRQAIWDQCWKFWQIHFGWQQLHCGLGQIHFEWEEIHSESIEKIYFFTNQSFYHLEAMASLTSNRMDWSPEPLRARNSYTTNAPKYENRNTRFPALQMLPNIR